MQYRVKYSLSDCLIILRGQIDWKISTQKGSHNNKWKMFYFKVVFEYSIMRKNIYKYS